MRVYTQEEKQASLTVLYPVRHLRRFSTTPIYPRVPFTVGYALVARNRKPKIEGQLISVIFICSKTRFCDEVYKNIIFYNTKRSHKKLQYKTPEQKE